MAVAFDLVPERADHLAVAHIAPLADVDVATRQFQRRVGPHALHLLDRVLEVEQRAISTMPPMETTTRVPTIRSVALRSIMPCFS
jgi:hypothetical protein